MNMRKTNRTITAICPTREGIEWTILKVKPEETETLAQKRHAIERTETAPHGTVLHEHLPAFLANELKGDICTALPCRDMFFRTTDFPTTDPAEIASMVGFQIDKAAPFPAEQMAIAHEVLHRTDERTSTLMLSAQQHLIDHLQGYNTGKHHLERIDVRILCWLELLAASGREQTEKLELHLYNDGIDLALVALHRNKPVFVRPLHIDLQEEHAAQELAYEIGYSFTSLENAHAFSRPGQLHVWSIEAFDEGLGEDIQALTGLGISTEYLHEIPPLSEGILRRTLQNETGINLVPQMWIDQHKQRETFKRLRFYSAIITGGWLAIFLVLAGIYNIRVGKLKQIQKEAGALASAARLAEQNNEKLKALKIYADRSASSLECLREVTHLLPAGDIEFASYNYSSTKGISLRGTAISDDIVYDFFKKLADSKLFGGLKNQSVNIRTTKGVQRTVFSLSLPLPTREQLQ